MAQKNIINKVKTASGYDSLYPLTPYQVHQARSVTGNGSNYAVTIDLPAANITQGIIVCFTPNVANQANCTIPVNSLAAVTIKSNGENLGADELSTSGSYLVFYDASNSIARLVSGGGGISGLVYRNKVVPTSAWAVDTTYDVFGYRADITCTGVTSEFYGEVVFDIGDSVSGKFAPVCLTEEDIVAIYASEIPSSSITIPTIFCSKGKLIV